RYATGGNGRRLLLATAGLPQQMHGASIADGLAKQKRLVCEGPWDGMALWEALGGNLEDTLILAVPGCGSFRSAWAPLFTSRDVAFLYDSDHPKLRCSACAKSWSKVLYQQCPECDGPLSGPEVEPAGFAGMRRAAATL